MATKILVTGATGFVGSQLCKSLVSRDFDVSILRRKSSDISEIKSLDLEHKIGDVTDLESVIAASRGVERVYHLAGLVGYSKAMRPAMDLVNVTGTKNVVEACKTCDVNHLIHMSSVTAIGASFKPLPLSETSKYNLSHLNLGYFETKRLAEELVLDATQKKQIQSFIFNPSTIYGPGDARKGSRNVQLKVARGKFKFYTSGGVNIISVHDVINCLLHAVEKGQIGERYILAGENIYIKQLFKFIAAAANVKPPSIYLPNAAVKGIGKVGDYLESIGKKGPLNTENAWTSILYHWFDSTKAQQAFSFTPRSAKLCIEESVTWMKDNGYLDK